MPLRKDTILVSLFDIFDSGIKCTGNSVGREEPVTLSSHVVIIGVSVLLRGGGDSFCAQSTVLSKWHQVSRGGPCLFWLLLVFQFADQEQLLKCLCCSLLGFQ